MSRVVIPVAPESIFSAARETATLPSRVTFVVNPGSVYSPQTGYPWYVQVDHEMKDPQFYSLVPQASNNQYVSHYWVESKRPRFVGKFQFTDAWISTHHRFFNVDNAEVHFSRCFFHPEKADDKLYFDRPPYNRVEIVVDGFIADREIFPLLEKLVPKEYEIRSIVQCLP